MSFHNDLLNNPRLLDKNHLPSDTTTEVHKQHSDGFPVSQKLRMVPLNRFNHIRTKPQTQLQSVLFTVGNQVDYYLANPGFTERLWLEVECTIQNAAVTLNVEFLIDRVEIISNGNIISTIRDYNLFHNWLFKNYDQTAREAPIYNKNSSLVAQSLAVGAHRFYIPIHSFVDLGIKMNAIKGGLLFRIYFSNVGVVAGLNTNCLVSSCDIISQVQQLSNVGESLEIQRKQNKMLKYRFLNPIRACSETVAMNASQQYNFRLTSLNSLSAFIVFHVVAVGGLPTAFETIEAFELLDENNIIVGQKNNYEMTRLTSLSFPGWVNTLSPNIYVIPFCFTQLAKEGTSAGFFKMTTKEQIRIYTPSTWVNGNYKVEAYSYDYNVVHIDKGTVNVSK